MAVIKFYNVPDETVIELGGNDQLKFTGGISAADVRVTQSSEGVELKVDGKSVILKDYVLGNLSLAEIVFADNSELLVGDTIGPAVDDDKANTIRPTRPAEVNRDQLIGLDGDDDMNGGRGADLMYGGGGNDMMDGGAGDDLLVDGRGTDTLNGGAGNDTLRGGVDNDLLIGGVGADQMEGEEGDDVFFIPSSDSAPVKKQYDTILQFMTGSDKLDLDVQGSEAIYIEKDFKTNDFATAKQEAVKLLVQNEGLKDYVFISGKSVGWLFGEFTDDINFDVAVKIQNGGSLDSLAFSDII
jgi:Ca2+-binding RTX toxin-like protein